jgi:hypothetical protein
MRIRVFVLALFVFAAIGVGGVAHARDFCLDEGGSTWVGKSFHLPRRGQCKPWNGYLITTFSNVSISTGTGCTSSDGTTFRLRVSSARENVAFVDYMTLPVPGLSGGQLYEWDVGQTNFGPSFTFSSLKQIPCPETNVPVP